MKRCTHGFCLRLTAALLIVVMGFWISNKILFMHTHILDDGTRIGHAHPYDKSADPSPFKTHPHSRDSLFFFQHADTLFLLTILSIPVVTGTVIEIIRQTIQVGYPVRRPITRQGRAPPVLTFFSH